MTEQTELNLTAVDGAYDRSHYIIVRSDVPVGKGYLEYKEYLRNDFFYSCGYCTLSEFEAQGIRFTIDHYEPRSARPDLEHQYTNLMYACDECNTLKGDLTPPAKAREEGLRFFRPDQDIYPEHFTSNKYRVNAITKIGEFSIEMLDLNRQSLRRLREIRDRLQQSDDYVTEGILALRRYKIDQLPSDIKGRAFSAIRSVGEVADRVAQSIDDMLRAAAQSSLLDEDADRAERREERTIKLSSWRGLHPGQWRGRQSKRSSN